MPSPVEGRERRAGSECPEIRRGASCVLDRGHDGPHQAVMLWEPKKVGREAAIATIQTSGVHLHSTATGRVWKLVMRKSKTPCSPAQCIKFSRTVGGASVSWPFGARAA